MTDPKIRYDIQATALGGAEVAQLASELAKIDAAIDPQTAVRAAELSTRLQQLGQQDAAIAAFFKLKAATEAAAESLVQAQAAAQKLGQEIAASEQPTRSQTGQFEKLRDAVQRAKDGLQDQTQALALARGKLTELGLATDGLAAKQGKVGQALESAKLEARALAVEYGTLQTAQQAAARAADESRQATQRLVAESRSAGDTIKAAFAQTGVRSLQAIEAEIGSVTNSVSLLERRFRTGAISAEDLARAVAGAAVRMNALNAEIAKVPALPGQFARLGDQVNGLVSKFGALSAAVGTVGFAAKSILDATIALDSMRRVLTTVTGSAEKAQEQIDFLRVAAQRSGQSFDTIGQSFAKFAASAVQSGLSMAQIRDVFGAVTLAAGNLGLSTEKTENALNALGQIASKGVVSMEELRQQLGEALPGVLPLLAKELGLTQSELQKVVASGQLLATEAIPAIGRSLASLQPQGGVVSGLTAQWNRFVNVVKEAGTVVTEGPIGSAAGVVIGAFAGVIRDLAVVVTGASEAFKFFGLAALSVFDALRGDITFAQMKERISDFAVESGNRLEKFQKTAYSAGEATTALSASAQGLGTSFARLALDQQKAIDVAGLAVQTSEKHVEAMKAEGEASATLANLIGDEANKRQAAAQASEAIAAAAARHAAAEQKLLQVLIDSRAATIAKATAEGQNAEAIKATVDALNTQIEKANASAEKSQAQANASRAQARAMQLSSEAARDNSQRLDELRRNVEAAELAFTSQQRALRLDATTSDQVRQAAEALAKAKGLLRDAVDDLDAALKRQIDTAKADLSIKRAGLALDLELAKSALRKAEEAGNETGARQANLRILEIEQALARSGTQSKLAEAEATLKFVKAKEDELRALGQLTPEKQLELDLVRKGAVAATLEAAATDESNRAKDEQINRARGLLPPLQDLERQTDRNRASTDGHSVSVRGNSEALRGQASAADGAVAAARRYAAALDAVNPRLVSGSGLGGIGPTKAERDAKNTSLPPLVAGADRVGQLKPPDNSGGWFLDTTRRGEGEFGLGVWTKNPGGSANSGFVPSPGSNFGNNGLGRNAPAFGDSATAPRVAPAPSLPTPSVAPPAPAPAGSAVTVNATIGGRNILLDGLRDRTAADRVVAALEEAYRAGAGV